MTNTDVDRSAPTRPSRRRWLLPSALAAVVVLGVLLAAFQPWKLIVDKTVDEAAPPVSSTAVPSTTPTAVLSTTPTTVSSTTPTAAPTVTVVEPRSVPTTPDPATTATPVAAALVEPRPTTFHGKAHPTSGTVRLIAQDDGSRILRIEDLDTENGPDVKVVLSPDPDGYADGAIVLATLKGNKGNQNYVVPADVNLADLRSVVLWCKRFRVDFGVAPIPGI